ncbi:hypothetical protein GUJ93_ZPchr0010g8879 [Zizania palustris]|uniref:Uncharacterized protein n=1 Tax=Zizania palustris TaxID=103762 RepID=A0A8J5W7K0_ZIZPA|nr:hypothetical protein GUJ93_ZPchr0010g8879 [Zizania palustris]
MESAAALTTATTTARSAHSCFSFAAAHGAAHRRMAAAALGAAARRPGRRLRALPPELSEILSPKLVPGSPADTGDVSSLIPISALMLFFYFVSNWVVPEIIMKGMQQPKPGEEAASAPAATIPAVNEQGFDSGSWAPRSYKDYDLTQDLSDFIMSKASPPQFTGSPPVRASNPLVHDTQFCAWKIQNIDQSLGIPIPTKGCNVHYHAREGFVTKA